MTWEEAIKYCEEHKCKDCITYHTTDCRTEYEKTVLHAPCCINLVNEKLRGINYGQSNFSYRYAEVLQ